MTLLMAGLTIQCQQSEQDAIALKMIEGMQGALHLNRLTQQQLAVSANPQMTDSLMLQVNESRSLFTRLLNEYITNLGQVYEKKAGLFGGYRVTYSISSKADQSSAITPNQYAALMQTLHDASQQSDWSKAVTIIFPVISHENRAIVERDLSLNDIITGLKQVPLRAGYSTSAIVGGVAATAAIASGAYLLYNNMDALRSSVSSIESYFNGPTSAPVVEAPVLEEPVVEAQPSFFQNMKSGFRRGVYGDEDATVANWQTGGDAETYGTPGLTGQETLGAVAGAGALAAGAARMASSNATKDYLATPGISGMTPEMEAAMAASKAEAARAGQYQAGKTGMYAEMEAIQANNIARQLASDQAAAKAAKFNAAMNKINSRPAIIKTGPVTTASNNPGVLVGQGTTTSTAAADKAAFLARQQANNPASFAGMW